ncbi:MAG: methylmalonyl-CoA mutase [Gammaproteobacteria bacterium]|nr:MAG: methylmalonyl-CoA mutase [Gammaproteobacteria bacterium]
MGTMAGNSRKVRVLLAKSDQDAHDRGIRYIAEVLRDAGVEVIFIRYRICEEVTEIALQEDVDVLGMGFYSSGYEFDIPTILEALKAKGKALKFMVGGIISGDEVPKLKAIGVDAIFGPGTPTEDVVRFVAH